MKFDLMTGASSWSDKASLAADLESAGFSGMLFTETSQVPWMQIAAAATAAPSLELCTGIAVAFARSPMVTAALAWEIAGNTDGRFRLEITDELVLPRDEKGDIDIKGTTELVTKVVEGWVREHPEQWLWMHRRWG